MKKITFSLVLMGIALMTHAQIPSDSLVGYWSFNGNYNDHSGSNVNGLSTNTSFTTDRFDLSNSAVSFPDNNTNSVIDLGTTINPNVFSISIWFNQSKNRAGGFNTILSNFTGTKGFELRRDAFIIGNGSTYNQILLSADINKWYHCVAIYNGTTAKVYLNKLLIDSLNYGFTKSTSNLLVGDRPLATGYEFNFEGKIDDIRIYKNKVLSSNDIDALYNENICKTSVTVTDTLKIQLNPTSYKPMTFETTIKVYPNPTKDVLYINCGDYTKVSNYKLKITNSLSQVIWNTTITQNNYSVNMSSFGGTGLYFMEVYDANNNKIDVKKIVLY